MAEELPAAWAAEVFGRRLVQPDQRSCGAAVLVVALLLTDPPFARRVATPEKFRSEVLGMHRRVTSSVDVRGRLQVPWPRALGTPPWAVARQLSGTVGTAYRVLPAWADRYSVFDRLSTGTLDRRPVPLYVGNRFLPRHVVLVLGKVEGALRCYEPASGRLVDVGRENFVAGRLGLAGWDRPWFMILPTGRHSPASRRRR